jgi:antitoxin VapB
MRRFRRIKLSDRLLAIGKDCAQRLKEPFRSIDHGSLLYGDDGLPKNAIGSHASTVSR